MESLYVEPPTIPQGMTCDEYRRRRAARHPRRPRRGLAARLRRSGLSRLRAIA